MSCLQLENDILEHVVRVLLKAEVLLFAGSAKALVGLAVVEKPDLFKAVIAVDSLVALVATLELDRNASAPQALHVLHH